MAAVYFGAAKLGLTFAFIHSSVSPIWPPTGVAIAIILLFGNRVWPGIFLGALVANAITPVAFPVAVCIAVGNTLEALVAGLVLKRWAFHISFDRARDVFKFVVATAGCTVISATAGTLALCLFSAAQWEQFGLLWVTWWLGDLAGALTVAPLILVWALRSGSWLKGLRHIEMSLLVLLISIVGLVTFGQTAPAPVHYYPLTRLMIPFLLWAAFRLGQRGVTLAVALLSAFAVWGTVRGAGPFIAGTPNESLTILQLFVASNAVTFLFLAAVIEEKRLAEQARRLDERRLSTNLAISRILAESPGLNDATQRILKAIGDTLGWKIGAMWTVDEDADVLHCLTVWNAAGEQAKEFEVLCMARTFSPGTGLPGRVWQDRAPCWIRDVANDENFPRAPIALTVGLHAAFAFPVLAGEKFLGVMEFFSNEIRRPDAALLAMFGSIGSQIGQFMERRRAEETLRDREGELEIITETAPVMLIRCNRDLRYVFVNRAYAQMVGLEPQEIVGQLIPDVIGEGAYETILPRIEKVLQGESVEYEEHVTYERTGERFLRVAYRPDLDPQGKTIGWVGSITDVSESRRAEAAQRRSEKELNEFFENATEAIHWVGPDGKILRANRAELRLLGYRAEEYIGHHIAEFHVDQKVISDILDRLTAGESLERYPAQMRCKDGSVLDVLINSSVYFEKGEFIHTRCFTRDVTEQLRADKALRQLASIVETTDDAIIGKDLNGVVTSWNAAAEKLYGYKSGEIMGREALPLLPPDRLKEEPAILATLRRGESIDHFETVRLTSAGRTIEVSLTISPIKDASGRVVGSSEISRDITERKRAEAEREALLQREHDARAAAEEANRVKDEFLATLSHELRTPLNAILGWASLLQAGKLAGPDLSRALEIIERNAKVQSQLIEGVLDVSRIVSGKLQLDIRPLLVSEVVEAALDSIRPAAAARNITLRVISKGNEPFVSGDANRLQQVVWNLLSNAVKFTPPGGDVTVQLQSTESEVEIIVRDSGKGITESFLPHVFDRFRQADSSTTRRHGGLGLGLAIVRHLVELHGGSVEAESAGEGQGATFRVRLPAISERFVRESTKVQPDSQIDIMVALSGLKVLIVDDHADARELLMEMLMTCNAEVKAAVSATEALKVVADWQPAVVVSDISMPDKDGYTFVRELRTLDQMKKIPVIAVTAHAHLEDRRRALASGFQAHLSKPIELSELALSIAEVTGRAVAQNDREQLGAANHTTSRTEN